MARGHGGLQDVRHAVLWACRQYITSVTPTCGHVVKPAVDGDGATVYSFFMGKWIIGDVLEWVEPDWHVKGKRKKEYFKKGERRVTAQVTEIGRTYIALNVIKCEVISDQSATGVEVLKAGDRVVRKLSTFKARKAQRAKWGGADGEAAREIVTSRFLKPPPD